MDVIQVGLGPLGQRIVRHALERGGIAFVGAVDPAPDKAGRDLGKLCGLPRLGIIVEKDISGALRGKKAQVAILSTVSRLALLEAQVAECAEAKLHVVSTCEELVYPWKTQPIIAGRIDGVCKANGIACLGTGVNPGFLMDFLPMALSAICQRVDRITVSRVQDASIRRIPFQEKIGAGLTLEEFREKEKAGVLRHIGLTESIHMIADRLGWALDETTETLQPVIARRRLTTGYAPIERGMASGVEQIGRGFSGGKEVVTLEFRAAIGEPESFDRIEVSGEPTFVSSITGGINGDVATCAITINALFSIVRCAPGLKTMIDVPVPAFRRGEGFIG